ncbi:hypothetical protein C8R44DRAFT_223665 [Mycena epipterygia]|nr:hypothetical protein C8R44DRAFT_223665 [Mycena epipterygia]
MWAPRMRDMRLKKPPACDSCKARRVLCHPQPDGAPCPRCVEKEIICTTTPVPRGRPRKNPAPASTSSKSLAVTGPEPRTSYLLLPNPGTISHSSIGFQNLNPEFVAHCFECLVHMPQFSHPLIKRSSIQQLVFAASFELHRLPPQSRVLALCIIALSSLASFHERVLGAGPRPESFTDQSFFTSNPDVLSCGVRRSATCRALRAEALKAAWDIGIILQPSNDNAASCFLLDILEQSDFCGGSRPWASAYVSHIRALAPVWRTAAKFSESHPNHWGFFFETSAFIMGEALRSTQSRTAVLFTLDDQRMLCDPEPPSLEDLLASLETSQKPALSLLWSSMKPYMFHITCLARQLYETINGDYARLNPLSEQATIRFLSSLFLVHSILSLLVDCVEAAITSATNDRTPFLLDGTDADRIARVCAYAATLGFTGLVLPFYQELELRGAVEDPRMRERMQLLRTQAHQLATLGARAFVRIIRLLPAIHHTPEHWRHVYAWGEFCAAETDRGPERTRDLETLVNELKLMGYSLDIFSAPQSGALIQRLCGQVDTQDPSPSPEYSDTELLDMFLSVDPAWLATPDAIPDDGDDGISTA